MTPTIATSLQKKRPDKRATQGLLLLPWVAVTAWCSNSYTADQRGVPTSATSLASVAEQVHVHAMIKYEYFKDAVHVVLNVIVDVQQAEFSRPRTSWGDPVVYSADNNRSPRQDRCGNTTRGWRLAAGFFIPATTLRLDSKLPATFGFGLLFLDASFLFACVALWRRGVKPARTCPNFDKAIRLFLLPSGLCVWSEGISK